MADIDSWIICMILLTISIRNKYKFPYSNLDSHHEGSNTSKDTYPWGKFSR